MDKNREKGALFYSEVFDEAGSCIHDAELLLYFQQLLSAEKKKLFEEHLKECSLCSAALLELEEMEAAPDVGSELPDQDFYRLERSRLRESLQGEFPVREAHFSWLVRTFSFSPAVNAVMIVLILLLLYPAYRFFVRDADLIPEPELSITVIRPIRLQRSAQIETIDLTFNREQRSASIVLSLPLEDYSSFAVEISKAQKTVWQQEIHPHNSTISLILYRDYFQDGAYQLRVLGLSNTGKILLSQFTLNIRIH